LQELTEDTKGCIIIGASAFVIAENAWLGNYEMERITPSVFLIKTQ
jgi:hypothetical protein